MCLVTFMKDEHPEYPLILVANRDELYDRPAAPIHEWEDSPGVIAGVDLQEYGTWLGYTKEGKFITVLNHPFVEWTPTIDPPRSRGKLLRDYLTNDFTMEEFKTYLHENRKEYNGYHLLFGTFDDLTYYSNVQDTFKTFESGIHCLANTFDDLSHHRKKRSTDLLSQYVNRKSGKLDLEELTAVLSDKQFADKLEDFPEELDPELAKRQTAIFIQGEEFGTVGTTAILVDKEGQVSVREVKYNQNGITEITEKESQIVS